MLALGDFLINADGAEPPFLRAAFEGFTAAEGSEPELNERLAAYLDACMADPEGPEVFGCPFDLQEGDIDEGGFTLGDTRWEILEYPQATASTFTGAVYTEAFGFELLTRKEGRARVTAADAASGEEIVLECTIHTSGLYLIYDETGQYAIGPNQDPNPTTDPDPTTWQGGYEPGCEPV
jgi:hypothetical protein